MEACAVLGSWWRPWATCVAGDATPRRVGSRRLPSAAEPPGGAAVTAGEAGRPPEAGRPTAGLRLGGHLPALDGVRGLAILMVLLYHFIAQTPATSRLEAAVIWPLTYGFLGVDLFFVLSGFLITGILYESRGDPRYFRNFYMRRVLRIFPLYYAVLAVVFFVVPLVPATARVRDRRPGGSSRPGPGSTRSTCTSRSRVAGSCPTSSTSGRSPSRSTSISSGPSWSGCSRAGPRGPHEDSPRRRGGVVRRPGWRPRSPA